MLIFAVVVIVALTAANRSVAAHRVLAWLPRVAEVALDVQRVVACDVVVVVVDWIV